MQNTNIFRYPCALLLESTRLVFNLCVYMFLVGSFWLFHPFALVLFISHMELLASDDFSKRPKFMFLPGFVAGLLQPNICEGGT